MKPVEVITIYTSDIVGPGGPPGTAATITVGSTTTSEPGGNAAVSQSGTPQNRVLDFTIPRGAQGPKGDPGTSGITPLTGTLDDPGFSVPSGSSGIPGRTSITITVPGATPGCAVSIGIPATWTPSTYVTVFSYVSAANEVTVRVLNFQLTTTVPAGTWKALVWP